MKSCTSAVATTAVAALFALAPAAHAEVQNCTVINSLPTTLTAQGIYCLTHDVATGISGGQGILVNGHNITIDCNGFKIGGLAAGMETRAFGIYAENRLNTVVRNCSIRGFFNGVRFDGGSGHVVEDNRFDGNTFSAIALVSTDGDTVQRNHLVETGGNLPLGVAPFGATYAIGMQNATGTVFQDNNITNTYVTSGASADAVAIVLFGSQGIVRGNNVQGLVAGGGGSALGIVANGSSTMAARDNSLMKVAGAGTGIAAPATSYCADNHVVGFTTAVNGCTDGGGNSP